MSFLHWLKVQWVEPQYNKSLKMIAYYDMIIDKYSERSNSGKLEGRAEGTYLHAIKAKAVWEHKRDHFGHKLENLKRND